LKVLPVDRFELAGGRLAFVDLASLYGLGPALDIAVEWSLFDNERETSVLLAGESSAKLPRMDGDGYWLATLSSAQRPRQTVRVYVRNRGGRVELIGVERTW